MNKKSENKIRANNKTHTLYIVKHDSQLCSHNESEQNMKTDYNRINFESTADKKSIIVKRVETNKSFKIDAKHIKELQALIKKQDKKACHAYVLANCNYITALELDAQAKKLRKCTNTAYDSRYRLYRFINESINLQVYNKTIVKADVVKKSIKKAVSKVKASKKSVKKANKK